MSLKVEYFQRHTSRLSFSDDPGKTLTLEFPVTPRTSPVLLDQAQGSSTQGRGIKILPPKQMLQRLSILQVQVQAENTSKNLLNEI